MKRFLLLLPFIFLMTGLSFGQSVTAPGSSNFLLNTANQDAGDFIVAGFEGSDNLLVSIGLINPPTGTSLRLSSTSGVTPSTGYNLSNNFTRISFTGIMANVNAVLESLQVNTGSSAGEINISVSATLNPAGYYYLPATTHFYKPVVWPSSGLSGDALTVYPQVKTAAANETFKGQTGYLLTITSQEEQDFIHGISELSEGILIALTDKESEGIWKWDDGPESGTHIFTQSEGGGGSPIGENYNAWCNNEPNNYANERYVATKWGESNCWNNFGGDTYDLPGDLRGYVIEFGYWTDPAEEEFNFVFSNSASHQTYPSDPTGVTGSPETITCGGSTALTAAGEMGTVYWYTGSCGGTEVTTGNPVTVSPTVTTTYYARNFNNDLFSQGCASVIITVEEATPVGNISITSDGSTTPGDWILCEGRLVPLQNNPSVNVSVIHDYLLNHGDLVVEAAADLTFDASLSPELPAGRTLTFKAGNHIIFNEGATIAPTANALNVLIWPDSDAINGGRVSLNANASINTNNGHLWVGGGSGTTTWNGLTVGDGYAVSADGDVYPAISMENINISTGTGHQLYRGNQIHSIKSYKAIYIGGGSTIYSTTGAMSFDGLSNSSHAISFNGASIGWDRVTGSSGIITSGDISFLADKTEESNDAYPAIDSRDPVTDLRNNFIVSTGNISFSGKNNGEHFIRLYGDDRIGWNGTDEGDAYVAANISITSEYGGALLQHLPTNYANRKSRIYTKSSGTFSYTNQEAGSFTLSHPDGFIKAGNIEINCMADVNFGNWTANNGISVTAGGTISGIHDPDASSNTLKSTNSGTVTIKADAITLGSDNRIESAGELHVKPFTAAGTIGIAGAAGILQLPANYFTTNFSDGFSQITIGSGDQTGNINLNSMELRDNMRLQTNGKVVVKGNQTITLPNGLRLQVDNELEMETNARIDVEGQ